jgi:adenosylcobinamide kinase / adenosylcobinamide-phosphate guanylyltransferase
MQTSIAGKHLIVGGARSGKSRYGQQLAEASGKPVVFVATGDASDAEMAARIAKHQAERPADWRLVEVGQDLAGALREHASPLHCLLVDCLTLWLGNLLADTHLLPEPPDARQLPAFVRERQALLDVLPGLPGDVIFISNEVGLGIVPLGATTRLFRDEAGRLNQDLAALCDAVSFVAAGLPLALKRPI